MPLAGYAAREGVCLGVHDDLFARALVLEEEGEALVLVSVDLLALSDVFVQRVRQNIYARTGIPRRGIMVSATHTHAGPVTISTFFNPGETLDAGYMDHLARVIEDGVVRAWRSRRPARIGVGVTSVDGLGANRRSVNRRPIDPDVGVIRVEESSGRPMTVVVNYACHPTVLGPDNLLASGDFPAFAVARVEAGPGQGARAMFVNGAQGDVSVGHSSELSAIGVITPGRTFERAEEIGNRLADAVLATLPSISTTPRASIAARSEPVELAWRQFPPPDQTRATLEAATERLNHMLAGGASPDEVARARTERLYASITHFYGGEAHAAQGPLTIEVQAFRIDGAALIAVPAEVFVSIGLRVKRAAPRPILLAGVTNGYIAYLPDSGAYAVGGYEVVSSKCAEDSEARLVDGILALQRRLFDGAATA